MHTFEGIIKLKKHKNDHRDWLPLTIDFDTIESLKKEITRVKYDYSDYYKVNIENHWFRGENFKL